MSKVLPQDHKPSNRVILIIFTWIAMVLYTTCQQQAPCPQHCLDCEPGIGLCYACSDNYEADIFGTCHEPKVQNCVMYGLDSTCARCRPTFILHEGKCQKLFNGCLYQNGESSQQCWQCGFGMRLDATKSLCVGTINCASYKSEQLNSQCLSCADGYQLQAKDSKQVCVDKSVGCSQKNSDNGLCIKCKQGYFYSGYQCIEIQFQNPLCYISNALGKCIYCKQGLNVYEGQCMTMSQMKQKFPGKQISVDGQSFKISSGGSISQNSQSNIQGGFILPSPGPKQQITDSHEQFSSGINLLNSVNNSTPSQQSSKNQSNDTKQIAEHLKLLKLQQIQQNMPVKNKQYVQTEQQYKNNQLKNILNFTDDNSREGLNIQQYSLTTVPNSPIYVPKPQSQSQTNAQSNPQPNPNPQTPLDSSIINTNYSVNINQSLPTLTGATPKAQPKIKQAVQPSTSSISVSQSIISQQNQQPQQPYLPQQIYQSSTEPIPQNQGQPNPQYSLYNGYSSSTSQFNIDYSNPNSIQVQNSSPTKTGGATILNQQDLNCQQFGGQGQCQKCSTRYYVDSTGFCVPVHPLCKDYNERGDCTGCYKGYSLSNGKCIITLQNDPYCKQFNGNACSQCYGGYFYSQQTKQCKRLNPLCRTSNLTTGFCSTCYSGYNLNPNNGNCEVYMKDPNCKEYQKSNSLLCQICADRFYVNSQTGTCAAANPLCKDYDRNSGKCTVCYPGYGLKDGQCVVGLVVDQYCKTLAAGSNNICSECFNGYYTSSDGRCRQANPLCRLFNPKNGSCTDCYLGYEVSQNGSCILSVSRDQYCKAFQTPTSSYCTECYHGYLAINGKCQLQNPLCKTVNRSTGACASCWSGYTLDAAGINCTVSVPVQLVVSDPYCVKIQNSLCIQCSNGYYYNKINTKCEQLDLLCKSSDMSNANCLSCYQGYILQDGKCKVAPYLEIANCQTVGLSPSIANLLVCQQCVQGYYLENGSCKLVSILCVGYNRSNGKCTGCIPGNFLQDGECIYPAIFDQHCRRYESSYCSKCREGFFVHNFMCLPIDRNCHKFNYEQNTCEECVNGLSPKGYKCE